MSETTNFIKGKNILLNLSSISYIELESDYHEMKDDMGEYVWEKCHKLYDCEGHLKFILVNKDRFFHDLTGNGTKIPYSTRTDVELSKIGGEDKYAIYPSCLNTVDGFTVSVLSDSVLYEKLKEVA